MLMDSLLRCTAAVGEKQWQTNSEQSTGFVSSFGTHFRINEMQQHFQSRVGLLLRRRTRTR